MTSNIGSAEIQKLASEEAPEWEVEARIKELLKQYFRPEFLNRVDEVILFHTLGKEHIGRIVEIQLEHLAKRLGMRNLKLHVSDAAKKLLADEGYDPQFGARPLKRVIQKELINELSKKILAGEIDKNGVVKIDAFDNGLVFVNSTGKKK